LSLLVLTSCSIRDIRRIWICLGCTIRSCRKVVSDCAARLLLVRGSWRGCSNGSVFVSITQLEMRLSLLSNYLLHVARWLSRITLAFSQRCSCISLTGKIKHVFTVSIAQLELSTINFFIDGGLCRASKWFLEAKLS